MMGFALHRGRAARLRASTDQFFNSPMTSPCLEEMVLASSASPSGKVSAEQSGALRPRSDRRDGRIFSRRKGGDVVD